MTQEKLAVCTAFIGLEFSGIPKDEWQSFMQGNPLSWPSSIEGATDTLSVHRLGLLGRVSPIVTLSVEFKECEAITTATFSRNTGRIMDVSRYVGRITREESRYAPFSEKSTRVGVDDYSFVAGQLAVGTEFFKSLHG